MKAPLVCTSDRDFVKITIIMKANELRISNYVDGKA